MNEAEARKELGDMIKEDNRLYCPGRYVSWLPADSTVCLDDNFDADELEAIVWWMRNKSAGS